MSKPILYYIPGSPPARSVMLVVKALDIDLELRLLDMANKEHLSDAFLKINPQHTVPTLTVEGGQSLWDSHAILTYLIERYAAADNDALYPSDLLRRARIHQRLHFDTAVLFPLVADLYMTFAVNGGTEVKEQTVHKANEAFALLEIFLGDGAWLVGNTMTVADLSLITAVTQISSHVPVDAKRYARLAAWMDRFEADLPYFAAINTTPVANYVEAMSAAQQRNKVAKGL